MTHRTNNSLEYTFICGNWIFSIGSKIFLNVLRVFEILVFRKFFSHKTLAAIRHFSFVSQNLNFPSYQFWDVYVL